MKRCLLYNILLATSAVLLLTSCKKWLNVQPEDRFTEDMIFKNEQGFSDALNGIYIKMAEEDLYGSNLTLTMLDLMAGRYYNTSSSSVWYRFVTHEFEYDDAKKRLAAVWEKQYLCIANVNRYIENTTQYKDVLSAEKNAYYKGQALGLRAFLYFDLLRMWGPVYNSADSLKAAIPIYKKVSPEVSGFHPATVVIESILNDLYEAEQLLAADPVVDRGYSGNNNFRMNLYAVKGLMARVLLYRGNKTAALAKAKEVIAAQNRFPWVSHSALIDNRAYPDRVFGTEILFGLYTRSLYDTYKNLFDPEVGESIIMATGASTLLDVVYEGNLADYRNTQHWLLNASGVPFKTLYKFADVADKNRYAFRFMMPLIRMSEMYYIAAESEPVAADGLKYLDSVRFHRNVKITLAPTAKLDDEIAKEYQKEFYGEGQLWYFYKRRKFTKINSANDKNGVTITPAKYVLAYPDSETSVR